MKKFLVILSLLLVVLLSSCSKTQVGWVEMNYGNDFQASYQFFDGKETEKIKIDAGDNFSLTYDVDVDDGALTLEFSDPDGNVVWEETFLEDAEDTYDFIPQKSGRFTLTVSGDQTEGGFDLTWDINN